MLQFQKSEGPVLLAPVAVRSVVDVDEGHLFFGHVMSGQRIGKN
jgi:hypothetical protein